MGTENAQPEPIRLVFAKGTDVGCQRTRNEDFVEAFNPPDPAQRRQKGLLFIVADGMGGHQAGEVASETAVRTISREYYADPDPTVATALVRAVQKANAVIHQRAQETVAQVGMGTTAVAAVVRGNELVLTNVGDSRAYLVRNGTLRQVTRDHSFVEEQIRAGILSREEARTHPQRNVITRALGPNPDVDVDTYGGQLTPGDRLLLCTDGLSEYAPDQEIETVLQQFTPQEAVDKLIALAKERGGSDNITALLVHAAPAAEPAGATQRVPVAAQNVPAGPPAAPPAPPTAAADRTGLSLPLLLLLGAGILLIVAGVVAGVFFFGPGLGLGRETPTATASVSSGIEETPLPASPLPTSTPRESGEATATPRLGLDLVEPRDGATIAADQQVDFQWRLIGRLPDLFDFVVKTDSPGFEELCRIGQQSCSWSLDPGMYEWWVELWSGGNLIRRSDRWTLEVQAQPAGAPLPSSAPVTTTGDTSPVETPDGAGGDG